MDSKYLLFGAVTALFVFSAYFIGLFQGQRHSIQWREFSAGIKRSLTWKGVAWSLALPALWILLYYALIAHIRLALGRWPKFGESLASSSLTVHYEAVIQLLGALVGSLYVVPVIAGTCALSPRWRRVSIYSTCYAAGVGVAWGVLFLAPHPFLDWLFD